MAIRVRGVASSLKQLDKDIAKETNRQLDRQLDKAYAKVKEDTPVDTGFLKRQWRRKIRRVTKGYEEHQVDNAAAYADDVEFGRVSRAPTYFIRQAFMKFFDVVEIEDKKDEGTRQK